MFGKCANMHGHNYVLEVVVGGEIDQARGYVMDLKFLSDVICRRVIRDVDHRNLNTDVPWLADRIPTAENLAVTFWERLRTELPEGRLRTLRVWETDETGQRSVTEPEPPPCTGRELHTRYTAADLRVFTAEEARRFVPRGDGDPRTDTVLAWELLYRLEPDLYDRLASAERLHPGILGWLPRSADRIVEVGAGTRQADARPHRSRTRDRGDRASETVARDPRSGSWPPLDQDMGACGCSTDSSMNCLFRPASPTSSSHVRRSLRRPGMAAIPACRRWSGCANRAGASPSSGQTTSTGLPRAAISTSASAARWPSNSPVTRQRSNCLRSSIPRRR